MAQNQNPNSGLHSLEERFNIDIAISQVNWETSSVYSMDLEVNRYLLQYEGCRNVGQPVIISSIRLMSNSSQSRSLVTKLIRSCKIRLRDLRFWLVLLRSLNISRMISSVCSMRLRNRNSRVNSLSQIVFLVRVSRKIVKGLRNRLGLELKRL